MFKRPIIRKSVVRKQFVSEVRANGSVVSSWVPASERLIPSGSPGIIGEIVDKMRLGVSEIQRPEKSPWTPPSEYEFIARHMPEKQRDAYITRCEAWFSSYKPAVQTERPQPLVINKELIANFFAKHSQHVPPIEERLAVYREAGYPEDYLERVKARDAKLEASSDERQKVLDTIFAKWPAANKTEKKKVIKAVKKRMPI